MQSVTAFSKPAILTWDRRQNLILTANEGATALLGTALMTDLDRGTLDRFIELPETAAALQADLGRQNIVVIPGRLSVGPQAGREIFLHAQQTDRATGVVLLTIIPAAAVPAESGQTSKTEAPPPAEAAPAPVFPRLGLLALTASGTIIGWDQTCETVFSRSEDDAYGKTIDILGLHSGEHLLDGPTLQNCAATSGIWRGRALAPDGRELDLSVSLAILPEAGEPAILVAFQTLQPSSQPAAEPEPAPRESTPPAALAPAPSLPAILLNPELANSATGEEPPWMSYFQNILNSADLGILVLDLAQDDTPVSLANHRVCDFLKMPHDELVGLPYSQLKKIGEEGHKDWPAEERKLDELLANPALERTDEMNLHGRILQRTTSPVRDRVGRIFSRIFFFRDVTSDRQMEHQLLHSQKMDSIGTLAGGVAHDFNNLLTTIQGYTDLLKKDIRRDSKAYTRLQSIEKASQRAAELTRNLLTFARFSPGAFKVFNINDLLRETRSILRSSIPTSIDLLFEFSEVPVCVEGDATQIQQIVINLVLNARDAISELDRAGVITVETRVGFDDREAAEPGAARPWAVIEVCDNGTGITPAHIARIFEPFFTTKEVGKGTGLGLAIVYGIIKKHNGFIDVTSAPGQGAKFTAYLPLTDKDPTLIIADETTDPARRSPIRDISILIVDDEEDLREFCLAGLEDFCREAHAVGNGEEALEFLKAPDSPKVDMVLLDLTMPKMSGHECFRHLRALDPNLAVVICSGYSIESGANELIAQGALAFLPKPYNLARLQETVDDILPQIKAKARDAALAREPYGKLTPPGDGAASIVLA